MWLPDKDYRRRSAPSSLEAESQEFERKGSEPYARRNVWGAHAPRMLVMAPRHCELFLLQDRHERAPRTIQCRRIERICAHVRLELPGRGHCMGRSLR